MAKYKPQIRQDETTVVDLDLCAKYDGEGNDIVETYAKKSESGGSGGEIVTITSSPITDEQLAKLQVSPFNKLEYDGRIYTLTQQSPTQLVYSTNVNNVIYVVTITLSTKAFTSKAYTALTKAVTGIKQAGSVITTTGLLTISTGLTFNASGTMLSVNTNEVYPVIDIGDVQTTTQGTLAALYYSYITSAKMSFLKATTGVNQVTIMPLVQNTTAGRLYEVTTGKTTYSVVLLTSKAWVYTKKTASSGGGLYRHYVTGYYTTPRPDKVVYWFEFTITNSNSTALTVSDFTSPTMVNGYSYDSTKTSIFGTIISVSTDATTGDFVVKLYSASSDTLYTHTSSQPSDWTDTVTEI